MDSLVASHALEAGAIKDILVEGILDQKVLARIKARCCCRIPPNIVRVDQDLELPLDFSRINRCENDNRGLVIAVVRHVKLHAGRSANIIGIIDRDFDDFMHPQPNHPEGILRTDFANLEMYFNSREVFENVLTFGFGISPVPEILYDSFVDILVKIYCIRLEKARGSIFVPMSFDQYKGFLRLESSRLILDENRFYPSWLGGRAPAHTLRDFPGKVNETARKVLANHDARHSIHGHDFTCVLSWLCSELGGAQIYRNPASIPGLLASAGFRDDFLNHHALFRSVNDFMRD